MNESFYVTLASNVKSFEENTISSFKTKLASKILLDDKWKVGISSINFTKSWYNIEYDILLHLTKDISSEPSHLDLKLMTTKRGSFNNVRQFIYDDLVLLKKGFYDNIHSVIKAINSKLNESFSEYGLTLVYDELTRKCSFEWTLDGINIVFPAELGNILGFEKKPPIVKTNKKYSMHGKNMVDLSRGMHFMYVYSDLIDPVYVGDALAPLLQTIPISNQLFGENVELRYENIHYHNLLCKEFETIEINIRDDMGQPIQFEFGRVVIVLHFKKWTNII